MPTIRDVARHAGVAISTASAALNRSAPVSEDVIAKVQEAVRVVGYVPHGGAQSLRSGQSRLIGLVVPNIANPHFSTMARVIENVCLNSGYLSVVYSSGQDADREGQILRMMRQQRIAGLILIPAQSDAMHGQRLGAEIQVPTVLLDMPVEGLNYDVVKLDNRRATRMATELLISLGHSRIAVLAGLPGLLTSEDRLQGYLDAHRAAAVDADPLLCLKGDFDQMVAFASVREAMLRPKPPTALLSLSNVMTLSAFSALRDLGLRIPNDVSVVGMDDLEFADLLEPAPTVIRVPIAAMAERAISLLLEEVETKRKPLGKYEVYAPLLVERRSCRRIGPSPN